MLELQGVYESGQQVSFRRTCTVCPGILSSQLLEMTNKMWITRCEIINEKTEDGPLHEDIRQMLEDIKEKYLLEMLITPPGDSNLMGQPLEAPFKLSVLRKKNWITLERISRVEASTERAPTLTHIRAVL